MTKKDWLVFGAWAVFMLISTLSSVYLSRERDTELVNRIKMLEHRVSSRNPMN